METRERGVFQMDTIPAIARYCRAIPKHCCGAGDHCHATAVQSVGASVMQVGRDRLHATSVEKAGIGSYEVSPVDDDSLSRIALEDVITAEHLRTIFDGCTAAPVLD